MGIWEQQGTLYTCGYLQMFTLHVDVVPQEDRVGRFFSNWLKKGKALCTSDSSFWFAGEEVGLLSGISLHSRFQGAEGLYWEQHQSCFPGLSQKSRECGTMTLGLTGILVTWSRLADSKTLCHQFFLPQRRETEQWLLSALLYWHLLGRWRHRCWGWLDSLTLNPLLSLLDFSGLKLLSSIV